MSALALATRRASPATAAAAARQLARPAALPSAAAALRRSSPPSGVALARRAFASRPGPSSLLAPKAAVGQQQRAYADVLPSSAELGQTPLHAYHVANGAKMVPFAGFSMPLSYAAPPSSGLSPHAHVRTHAGLFDVGHMVQSFFRGPGALAFLESLCPTDLSALSHGEGGLTVLLNDKGGIVDDTIVTKHDDETFYVVTNAGRREEDLALFRAKLADWGAKHGSEHAVEMEVLDGWGLVALQGPKSASVLQPLISADLSTLYFGQSTYATFTVPSSGEQVQIHIARGGYTGEDGFEISIPGPSTEAVTDALASTELDSGKAKVELIGLGARDSLRLEAGMCLYGHDLDESVTPVEAGLAWVISKSRRAPTSPAFPGKATILPQLSSATPPSRRRVGLLVSGAPAREGALLFPRLPAGSPVPAESESIGTVTSGIPSPTTGTNVAMGYVGEPFKKVGTELSVLVRKRLRDATVAKMPFVPAKYYRAPK